jgi:hypothetical protein
MVGTGPSVEPDVLQDTASRYADIALTSSLAATALRLMSENPEKDIPKRYYRALEKMAETVDTVVKLESRDRLSALVDQSLDVVENLELAQLVARIATEQEDNTEARKDLDRLLKLRDDLVGLLTSPNVETAKLLIPPFKIISRQAMLQAQDAEVALGLDESSMRSHLIRA